MSLMMIQAEIVPPLDLTRHWVGYAGLITFVLAYLLVALESKTHMRKSKPVIIAAGVIWMLAGLAYAQVGDTHTAGEALRTNIGSFGELFLFILSAMTFVNTMEDRQIFGALRSWLVHKRLTLRSVFWITGILSFFLSAQIDNMTTALVMGTVVLTVGRGKTRFIVPACVNVVVAANAGGAWTPFGDITSLMVWQAGILHFFTFFKLFVPALVDWVIPAAIMSLVVPKELPEADAEKVPVREGGWIVVGLFAVTVGLAVSGYNLMGLPPALGMMTGLGLLNVYGYYLRHWGRAARLAENGPGPLSAFETEAAVSHPFDIFQILQRAEWDTLMFFYGVIVAVGGLDFMGHLAHLSKILYAGLGPTIANTIIGIVSAFVDNIPVMYSVIQMHPDMHTSQWLLVTMTAGVGGSLLSIGSAAGVALMGQSRGQYTFADHLRWTWAVGLGYVAAIGVHLLLLGA